MKRILYSVLMTALAAAIAPSPRPLPHPGHSQRPAEIVCNTANDGEPFCIVFYADGEYCATYRSGEQVGPNCGD